MKEKRRGLLSFSKNDGDYFKEDENKIELLGCQQGGKNCLEHRAEINKNFKDSHAFHREKDYKRSIESLQNAFRKTTELEEYTCLKCANFFRTTITESLENIHDDLHKISTGFFKKKRFQSSYVLAKNVLMDFKKNSINGPL
ncbi:MAG: hypothetical protein WAO52_06830 [Prolixibacteraceae bacterium]